MARLCSSTSLLFLLLIPHLLLLPGGVYSSATFTLVNKCEHTVWPGILSNAGIAPLQNTGFTLLKGDSKTINAPSSWAGRFWGRTHCTLDSSAKFSCLTGDCGSGNLECSGSGAAPPATLAEFTLDGSAGFDFFDVSLVDGYNLPMMVVPQGGSGPNCSATGCMVDLNSACPSALKVMSGDQGVACKSACEAFGNAEYCCRGAYGTPDTCTPSAYSKVFKSACPTAYSYAYDDKSSTFTCAGADYLITFCPTPTSTSRKSADAQKPHRNQEDQNSGNPEMVYQGLMDVSSASSSNTCSSIIVLTVSAALRRWLFQLLI
ncbi:thaumatin-like protein 1b [Apium graveolens]|uniref:thaumatin-like protein 1b n=1 Tax=Apium graveolens TaxID=4045 RepID=UPI003D78B697